MHSPDIAAALVTDPALIAGVVFIGAGAGAALVVFLVTVISSLRKDAP
jgi:hypothetical protein